MIKLILNTAKKVGLKYVQICGSNDNSKQFPIETRPNKFGPETRQLVIKYSTSDIR